MRRRCALAMCWAVMGTASPPSWPQPVAQPSYKVSAGQLEHALSQRFPVRHQVEGFLDFDVRVPRLHLMPEHNRLASEMAFDVSGPALRRSYTGALAIDFELRYEPTDQSVRAHRLRVQSLRVPGLNQRAAEVLEAYGPMLAQQALHEVVLHRLRPQDLALADAMGLQPASITVTPQGLVIGFESKQQR
ncbi:MAG: DUF1439 domain-containing protein [Ramlibacter sp.]|nr:DUF1439 domain-containing protein [Ramlibacter sp.]